MKPQHLINQKGTLLSDKAPVGEEILCLMIIKQILVQWHPSSFGLVAYALDLHKFYPGSGAPLILDPLILGSGARDCASAGTHAGQYGRGPSSETEEH